MELACALLKNHLRHCTYKDDIKSTKMTGVQSIHCCAAWPWTKQQHVCTHAHWPEPVLSISTCLPLDCNKLNFLIQHFLKSNYEKK